MSSLLLAAQSFNVEYFNKYIEYQREHEPSTELANGVLGGIQSYIPIGVNIAFNVFIIGFLFACIVLSAAMITKNAQWQKNAVWGIIFTVVAVLALRLAPLLIITNDIVGIASLMRDIVDFLTAIGIHASIAMLLISLFLGMLHRTFEHPKYFKWSRSLKVGSGLVLFLSIVSPIVIGNI
ncbi:hypothetical protein [Bacillus anthracis]|uniref:Yip1 domain-containing protein n=1 Tax=Bacillus anthracis TaxID=1392 RepID=A0A0J1HXE0_BACAN|nr:hypothetical protein [Bacillus anthracis]KLV18349.1 hypothetical protein ABW01_13290 [Bacillus anthracis]